SAFSRPARRASISISALSMIPLQQALARNANPRTREAEPTLVPPPSMQPASARNVGGEQEPVRPEAVGRQPGCGCKRKSKRSSSIRKGQGTDDAGAAAEPTAAQVSYSCP